MNRAEFEDALRKGLGRALMHVSLHGLKEVKDLVLQACIDNQIYDRQCESDRDVWLFAMFRDSPFLDEFCRVILERLGKEESTSNLNQLFRLTLLMAQKGDALAQEKLRSEALKIASEPSRRDSTGAVEWITLDGMSGWLALARCYGRRLLANPSDSIPLDDLLYSHETPPLLEAIQAHSSSDKELKAYQDYLAENGFFDTQQPAQKEDPEAAKAERREKARKDLPIGKLLQNARDKKGNPGSHLRFGRHATPEELHIIYSQLIAESDDEVRLRLLWVFRKTPLPQLDECIFQWVYSTNDDLREASISALSHSQDARIHNLARAMFVQPKLTEAECDLPLLFIHNYSEDAAPLINSALKRLSTDIHGRHRWGLSIRELVEKHGDPKLADSLRWIYENSPCSLCRGHAVEQLHEMHKLDPAILEECKFDGADEIRIFARKSLGLVITTEL